MNTNSAAFHTACEAFDLVMRDMEAAVRIENERILATATNKTDLEGHLKLLNDSQSSLVSRLHSLGNAFSTSYAHARHQCNSLLPIHQLPPEIFVLIFENLVGQSLFADHYSMTYTLACVCRHWKTLIESTPSMWTKISSAYTERHVDNTLRRSGASPLLIDFPPGVGQIGPGGSWFPEKLLHHAHRWSSLRLSFLPNYDDSFLSLAMPLAVNIRYLCVSGMVIQPLQRPRIPSLLGAHIERNEIAPVTHLLTGLRYLKLSNIDQWQCSHDELVSLLTQNLELQHLALDTMKTPLPETSFHQGPVSLPHLKSLSVKLDRLDAQLFHQIVSIVDTPSLRDREYSVTATHRGAKKREVLQMIPVMLLEASKGRTYVDPPKISLDLIPRKNGWECSGISIVYSDADGSSSLSLAWLPLVALGDICGCLNGFLSHAIQTSPVSLKVTRNNTQRALTETHFEDLHNLFPKLVSFQDCRDAFTTTSSLCRFLSKAVDGAVPWHFPLLQELDLPLTNNGKHMILAMAGKRYGGQVDLEPPASLKRLNVRAHSGISDPVVDDIMLILGKGVVTLNEEVLPPSSSCWGQPNDIERWFAT